MTTDTKTQNDIWINTSCGMCHNGCNIKVNVVDGIVRKVEGNPDSPYNKGKICGKGNSGPMKLYDPYRVLKPLKRTNPKKGPGIDPGFVEITWDEALDTIAERMKKVLEEDPDKFSFSTYDWSSGFIGAIWAMATGTRNYYCNFTVIGSFCGEAIHSYGPLIHSGLMESPDIAPYAPFSKFYMILGTSLTEANLNKMATSRWFSESQKHGMKVVVVDPRMTALAAKADEWVPIRPGTDGALIFAMTHVLLHELNIFDAEYLKKDTNSGYLIDKDGGFVRDADNKPLLWDPVDKTARPFDDEGTKDIALEGGPYETPYGAGTPAFQLYKESVFQYTPEWASEITTIPAERIRRFAREFGEAASIGSTITIEGKEYPHRPVATTGYTGLNRHSNCWLTVIAHTMLNMLVGSLRQPGGLHCWDYTFTANLGIEHLDQLPQGPDGIVLPDAFSDKPAWSFEEPFNYLMLRELFPIAFLPSTVSCETQVEPERFHLKPDKTTEIYYNVHLNPAHGAGTKMAEALANIPFLIDVPLWLDETAMLSDIVLPGAMHFEKWSWLNWTATHNGLSLMQPVVEPMGEVRDEGEVFVELADRLGILTGVGGFLWWLNATMGCVSSPYVIEIDRKVSWLEIVQAMVEHLTGKDFEYMKEHGFYLTPIPAAHRYRDWGECRLPFYHLFIKETGDKLREAMKAARIKEKIGLDPDWWCEEYVGMPYWQPTIAENEAPEYDMYPVTWKTAITTHCHLPYTNPWLDEAAQRDPYVYRILINRETGERKGLKDDDWVIVESRMGKTKGQLRLTECIHHEVIGFPGGGGHTEADYKHPLVPNKGGHYNRLISLDFEDTGRTVGCLEGSLKCKIYKA